MIAEKKYPTVAVLMSTYNGEKYLREQIDSILSQKNVDITLFVRDDGSKDNTSNILKEYSDSNSRVVIVDSHENLGPAASFFRLITSIENFEFYSLSDQDDIWDDNKLSTAIEMIRGVTDNVPVLYYSNLRIVDQKGDFCRISHTTPHYERKKYCSLVENLATGCTIVYNDKLSQIARKVHPENYSMHDAWLYITAKFFGTVLYDFDPHISYRQHRNNVIGTSKQKISFLKIKQQLDSMFAAHNEWSINASIFQQQFCSRLSKEENAEITKIINYKNSIGTKIELLNDKKLCSSNRYRKLRMKIQILMGTL